MNPEQLPTDPQQPVAYDSEGRPLYAAPVAQPQFVHVMRDADPRPQQISSELKARHDRAVEAFPNLNLSESEYVVTCVPRHSIGMAMPIIATGLLVVIVLLFLFNLPALVALAPALAGETINYLPFWVGGLLLTGVALAGGAIAVWVFRANQLIVTNESVIQEIQTGLFAHNEQTTGLGGIEDVSYDQNGIFQMLFNYGSIRLATVGDETTYRLTYAVNPKQQVALINNAVEAFKNGRPITER